MKNYYEILCKVDLFKDISQDEITTLLSCLAATIVTYRPGQYVLSEGDEIRYVGVILEGNLHITTDDADGTRTIIAPLEAGDFFAEALCCAGIERSTVSVVADSPATVMFLEFGRILRTCPNSCAFHTKIIENMLQVIAKRNLEMRSRIEILSKKTIRARLMAYLQSISKMRGRHFHIPFNREELADFLCADRSALSRELGRLKSEGVIDFYKNKFKLTTTQKEP